VIVGAAWEAVTGAPSDDASGAPADASGDARGDARGVGSKYSMYGTGGPPSVATLLFGEDEEAEADDPERLAERRRLAAWSRAGSQPWRQVLASLFFTYSLAVTGQKRWASYDDDYPEDEDDEDDEDDEEEGAAVSAAVDGTDGGRLQL